MNPELAQHALRVMAGRVGADMEGIGNGGVRLALSQKRRYLELPLCKPVTLLQV